MEENKFKETKLVQEQKKANEFIKQYRKLCEEYGYHIVVIPVYKLRDDGTFSTVLQTSIGKLPKKNKGENNAN